MNESIYHYTKKSTAIEKILPSMQLTFNSISNTNDPRETKALGMSFILNPANDPDLWKLLDERIFHIHKNEFKQLSFSEDFPNNKTQNNDLFRFGYSRSRMWAQYAEEGSGLCLELDKTRLGKCIKDNYKSPEHREFSGSVIYDNKKSSDPLPPGIPFPDREKLGLLDESIRKYFFTNNKQIFFYKSEDWQSENEFRWILHCRDFANDHYISIPDSLKSIIVGPDFPKVYEPSLISICAEWKIPIGKLYWPDGCPLLGPTSVYDPK